MISALLFTLVSLAYGAVFYLLFSVFAGFDLTAWASVTVLVWVAISVGPGAGLLLSGIYPYSSRQGRDGDA